MKDFDELQKVLLDQIEKLNDDSIFDDKGKAEIVVSKSKAISDLIGDFVSINRLKLDVVKEMCKSGTEYAKFLGVDKS